MNNFYIGKKEQRLIYNSEVSVDGFLDLLLLKFEPFILNNNILNNQMSRLF